MALWYLGVRAYCVMPSPPARSVCVQVRPGDKPPLFVLLRNMRISHQFGRVACYELCTAPYLLEGTENTCVSIK